jgi:hypothetical protein
MKVSRRIFSARSIVCWSLAVIPIWASLAQTTADAGPGGKVIFPIFWTFGDKEIENPDVMKKQFMDIKQAGFGGVYCMIRATRYHLFDAEVTEAARLASRLCLENGMEFVWGPDPRFAATAIVRETGYGAEMLMVNREFNPRLNVPEGADLETVLVNEAKVEDGRYNLRYAYPARRDLHMLTEVSLWLNPLKVEKVYAYRRKGNRVIASTVRDITPGHHLFVNRAFNYIEVFGKTDLPEGEWYVFAFPKFGTNMYAYDSPEHEALFLSLIDQYKREDIHFNGFWWDEPGYYFQFGHFAVSRFIYGDFQKKYGYDLRENLYALTLNLDDDSFIRVRTDYFNLLMDYVFGGEQRLWQKGEALFGPLRMGIHQTWHWLPDDVYAGAGDVWKGLVGVDGGYTDEGNFERYFRADESERYIQVSRMMVAASLAKFSRDKKAHFNQWGVQYGNEVPVYWNDLMAAFSNEWINHCYGYTGVLGADRNFGPGFPNHESWALSAGFNERNRRVLGLTQFNLPSAQVAIVYPNPSVIAGWGPQTYNTVREVDRLIGVMPALGVQADVISNDLLASGRLDKGELSIGEQRYRAVILPCAKVITPECLAVVEVLKKKRFPVYFINDVPSLTTEGKKIRTDFEPVFHFQPDVAALKSSIQALRLPSPCTGLEGAYLNVIPGSLKNEYFLTVMPVEPGAMVGGIMKCMGKIVAVKKTSQLSIYRIHAKKGDAVRVF